jgi:hypothetical protein
MDCFSRQFKLAAWGFGESFGLEVKMYSWVKLSTVDSSKTSNARGKSAFKEFGKRVDD